MNAWDKDKVQKVRIALVAALGLGTVGGFRAGEPPVLRGRFTEVRSTPFNSGVNTGDLELHPVVSPDGKELYFSRYDTDMFVATRESAEPDQPFGDVRDLQELAAPGIVLNSWDVEAPGSMSHDLTQLYFSSFRDGTCDIFVAERAGPGELFVSVRPLGPKVTLLDANEGSPRISSDGLTLYYVRNFGHPSTGLTQSDIWIASRESTEVDFGDEDGPDPVPLNINTLTCDEYRGSISTDDLFFFFSDWYASNPCPGGLGNLDIWVTARSNAEELFGQPVNLNVLWPGTTVNSAYAEASVQISADWPAYGSKIYFASDRPGMGSGDIWEATWTPIPPLRPRNLTAAPGDGKVDLTWEPADGGEPAVGYNVYRRAKPATTMEKVNANLVTVTAYTDGSVTNGVEYCYHVRAVSEHGVESTASNSSTAVCVTPGPPAALLRRGDSNADGKADISDAVTILGFLFLGGPMNDCRDAADVNDDGKVDLSDPIRLLGFLFLGSETPPAPFDACGVDPTPDDPTAGELGCNMFDKCS